MLLGELWPDQRMPVAWKHAVLDLELAVAVSGYRVAVVWLGHAALGPGGVAEQLAAIVLGQLVFLWFDDVAGGLDEVDF